MYESNAAEFAEAVSILNASLIRLQMASSSGFAAEQQLELRRSLCEVKLLSKRIRAGRTEDQVGKLIRLLRSEVSVEEIEIALKECKETFLTELGSCQVLLLDSRATKIYKEGELYVFGECMHVFPTALNDIVEATKCYALKRWAAAIFHFVRVIEVGLKKLARHFELPIDFDAPDCTWDKITEAIIERWPASEKEPVPPSRRLQDEAFFHDCVANLRSVEKETHNSELHFRDVSSGDAISAQRVLSVTSELMQDIATRTSRPY